MLRPVSLLPALVAAASLAAVLIGTTSAPADAAPKQKQAETAPLTVTIDSLNPSTIPRKGPVRVSGTVTNQDHVAWTGIQLFAFASATPMTTEEELSEAAKTDPDLYVGDRILDTFATVDELEPGATASYTITVPRADLPTTEGVYWFGVHALGTSDDVREPGADGRARTFLPLIDQSNKTVETSLVVPVRRSISHTSDGRIAHIRDWTRSLSAGGALSSLVDIGAGAGTRPITWLVDPAVIDAAERLSANNPPRSLGPTLTDGGQDGESTSPSPTDEPTDGATDGDGEPTEPTADQVAAAAAAASWLDRLHEGLDGDQILTLPYGDVDVAAAAEHDPAAYREARRRSAGELQPWGLPATPAVSSPSGYLDEAGIRLTQPNDTVLVSDQMFKGGESPPVVRTAGRTLAVASSGAASGGPGPDDPLAPVAVRQRIVSEAAVRLLASGDQPLIVVLPPRLAATAPADFFTGLDPDWLDLTSLAMLTTRPPQDVPTDRIDYPESESAGELDAPNFSAAHQLARAGDTLQNLLTQNDQVGGEVRDEAMSDTSYSHRSHAEQALLSSNRSQGWIDMRLASVRIDAPKAVVLSSGSGRFAATVSNGLDEPVTVKIAAEPEPPLKVTVPADNLDLGPNSRTTVLLNASSGALGIRNVTLSLTDVDSVPLGSSDELPIRSNRVSNVIWLIIGTGVALLFGAIIVRLIRRVRAAARS